MGTKYDPTTAYNITMAAGARIMGNAHLIGQRRSGAAINFNTECVFGTRDIP